jgi:hypothetical protein
LAAEKEQQLKDKYEPATIAAAKAKIIAEKNIADTYTKGLALLLKDDATKAEAIRQIIAGTTTPATITTESERLQRLYIVIKKTQFRYDSASIVFKKRKASEDSILKVETNRQKLLDNEVKIIGDELAGKKLELQLNPKLVSAQLNWKSRRNKWN